MNRFFYPKYKNCVLVVHRYPDADCAAAVYLFLRYLGLEYFSPNIRFSFVETGEKYAERPKPDEFIVHLDTGKILKPETAAFDHHFEGCLYDSATGAIFAELYNGKAPFFIRNLVDYVDRVDSGNKVKALTQKQRETLDILKELAKECGDFVKVIPNYPGPTDLAERMQNYVPKNPATADLERLKFGLDIISSYVAKYQNGFGVKALLEETVVEEHGGLRFAMFPPHDMPRTQVRSAVKRLATTVANFDVFVTEHLEGENGENIFGVTIVNDAEGVEGMADLAEKILEADPQLRKEDVFVHLHEFVLYVNNRKTSLKLEDVFRLTCKNLRPANRSVKLAI